MKFALDAAQLVSQIQAWGQELAFSQIGVAGVDLSAAEPGLQAWLSAGCHGDMAYMAAHGMKRARPAELVPGTLSVITARMDYLPVDTLLEKIRGANDTASTPPGGTGGGTSGGSTSTPPADDEDLLADFLGGYTPGSMLVNMAPEMHNKTGTSKSKDMTVTGDASRYFAATINEQRNAWLSERTFDAAVGFSTPEIRLPLGFINIKFNLSL